MKDDAFLSDGEQDAWKEKRHWETHEDIRSSIATSLAVRTIGDNFQAPGVLITTREKDIRLYKALPEIAPGERWVGKFALTSTDCTASVIRVVNNPLAVCGYNAKKLHTRILDFEPYQLIGAFTIAQEMIEEYGDMQRIVHSQKPFEDEPSPELDPNEQVRGILGDILDPKPDSWNRYHAFIDIENRLTAVVSELLDFSNPFTTQAAIDL